MLREAKTPSLHVELFARHADNPILTAHDWPYPAHTVFNAGLGVPWEVNRQERRHFAPLSSWVAHLGRVGLVDTGRRLLQAHDPTDNTLLAFVKEG